jgi:hypothetical protein
VRAIAWFCHQVLHLQGLKIHKLIL